jgi:hypothetical protein
MINDDGDVRMCSNQGDSGLILVRVQLRWSPKWVAYMHTFLWVAYMHTFLHSTIQAR